MKIHIVQKGDTLWEIAKQYGVDIEELKELNSHLSSPDMIMPGMKIKIPSSSKQVKTKPTPKEDVTKKDIVKKQEEKKPDKKVTEKKQEQKPSKKEYQKPELKPEPMPEFKPKSKSEPKQPVTEGGLLQPLKKPHLNTELKTDTLIVGSKKPKPQKQVQPKQYQEQQHHVEHKNGHTHKQYKDQIMTEHKMMPMPMPTIPPVQQSPGYGHMYPPCCCYCMMPYHVHHPNMLYAQQKHVPNGKKQPKKQPKIYEKYVFNNSYK